MNATVIYANTRKLSKFNNYQLTLKVNPDKLPEDLKAKVKSLEVDDEIVQVIKVTSKYPIRIYGTDNMPIDCEVGRGTKLVIKLSLDTRFSKAGSVRLETAKVKELIPYIPKAEQNLSELDAFAEDDDLPF